MAPRALFACAFLLLGCWGFALGDASIFEWREGRDFDRRLRDQRAASYDTSQPESSASPKGAPSPKVTPVAAMDGLIGRIEIPRLLLSAVVVEGIDKTTLRRAVGHICGTALPGQAGNVGLAGLSGDFKYVVESLIIVEPDNI